MKTWLVDTGGFVAYLDTKDVHHKRVSVALDTTRPAIWTTMPVIAEAMYMLGDTAGAPAALVTFLEDTCARIAPTSNWEVLRRAVTLMRKYNDTPMDFADASLVCLAEELNLLEILTVDERGFRTFRTERRQAFHLVLDDFLD